MYGGIILKLSRVNPGVKAELWGLYSQKEQRGGPARDANMHNVTHIRVVIKAATTKQMSKKAHAIAQPATGEHSTIDVTQGSVVCASSPQREARQRDST